MRKIANALQPVDSTGPQDWRTVYEFWFPAGFDENNLNALHQQLLWWMRGGATPELPPFAPVLEAARSGRLQRWLATPRGRLSLLIVLDQFPRGLFSGTAQAYASDAEALRFAE